MSGGKVNKKFRFLEFPDIEVDLVPLIDCVFLLLLFFMLCGRMATDNRTEQITVPPTKTAMKPDPQPGWQRVIVNVFGATQAGKPPRNTIRIGTRNYTSEGTDNYSAYQAMRKVLDSVYDKAEKYPDPKPTGMMLPKVVLELRADADTEYRVVQEVQQVATDTIDPFNEMKPKMASIQNPKAAKPFVNIDFTSRKPGE